MRSKTPPIRRANSETPQPVGGGGCITTSSPAPPASPSGVAGRPERVLDVGCGTGLLLRVLAPRLPDCQELAGIDPAAGMIQSRSAGEDHRPRPGGGPALP
ncbi:MAG: class I SAM-dependent methyltransferase [Acidimicrobiia bacterium]